MSVPDRLDGLRVLLCDADGCLFPSETPAFDASTDVTNRLLAELGIDRRFTPEELRGEALGKNFRATAADLAVAHGRALPADELDRWVAEEMRAVSAHLARVLAPDDAVRAPLTRLASRFELSVVSSSALVRLDACFTVTALDELFPAACRYSAEDSLPTPTSKPDPAVYAFAGKQLGIATTEGLAVEDSTTGVRSAVAAGFGVVGNVQFVPAGERAARDAALRDAGAFAVVEDWTELEALVGRLTPPARAPETTQGV